MLKKMFQKKDRVVEIKFKKQPNTNDEIAECAHFDPYVINNAVKDTVTHAAIAVVSVMVISTILHTASEVIINLSKPKED